MARRSLLGGRVRCYLGFAPFPGVSSELTLAHARVGDDGVRDSVSGGRRVDRAAVGVGCGWIGDRVTDDRARKKAVRRRMAQTGEKYTEALRALQEAAREAADRGGAVDRPPSGFQLRRFTEQSRQVVVLAREEAHTLKHDFVGGEHILFGLLRERGFAAWVLESLGVTVERVRVRVVEIVGLGETVIPICVHVAALIQSRLVSERIVSGAPSSRRSACTRASSTASRLLWAMFENQRSRIRSQSCSVGFSSGL